MTIHLARNTRRFIQDFVADEISGEEIDTMTGTDPFLIDDQCPQNPEGHFQIWAGSRTLVCAHCAKVMWSA